VNLNVDPWGVEGAEWLKRARDILAPPEGPVSALTNHTLQFFLESHAAIEFDIISTVYNKLWMVVLVVTAIVVVFMLIAFRSISVALKTMASIVASLMFVCGSMVLIYERGTLDWLDVDMFKGDGGICWLPPIIALGLLVGLSLDYHVFLMTRIVEFRQMGLSDVESVLCGLAKTGHLITTAGIIMTVGFMALLFAETPVLNELGCFIIVAVLFDAFVVRACLVPAIMILLGRWNWWPRQMPPVDFDLNTT